MARFLGPTKVVRLFPLGNSSPLKLENDSRGPRESLVVVVVSPTSEFKSVLTEFAQSVTAYWRVRVRVALVGQSCFGRACRTALVQVPTPPPDCGAAVCCCGAAVFVEC